MNEEGTTLSDDEIETTPGGSSTEETDADGTDGDTDTTDTDTDDTDSDSDGTDS
jgi:hypothetical protein